MAKATYDLAADGIVTSFRVRPASAPWPIALLIFIVILFGFGLLFGTASLAFGLLVCLGPICAFAWIVARNTRLRRAMEFSVTNDEIQIGDVTLATAAVHRLMLRNHVTELELSPDVAMLITTSSGRPGHDMVMGASMGGAMISRASRQRWDRKRALVSWRLDADSGGRATTLACGMDEVTAYGLLRETAARLPRMKSERTDFI